MLQVLGHPFELDIRCIGEDLPGSRSGKFASRADADSALPTGIRTHAGRSGGVTPR